MPVLGFPKNNHTLWAANEARRALRDLQRLAGYPVVELRDEVPRQPDGSFGEWSALTHTKPKAAR